MPTWFKRQTRTGTSERTKGRVASLRRSVLSKRRKFLIVSILLSVGLLFSQRLPVEKRYLAIGSLAVASYALTAWSLIKDLRGVAWLVNLILPTFFPTAVALFYFLLPQATATRLVVAVLFAVSMYGLLLTANIFAVASIRTIQLLRAARAVGFLLTILTSAFLFHVIFSLRVPLVWVTLLAAAVTYPLILQGAWAFSLSERLKKEMVYALAGTLILVQVAVGLSFWLIDVPLASVVLAMAMYVVLGLMQHELEGRLFDRTIQEYLTFAGIVFVVVTAAVFVRWTG